MRLNVRLIRASQFFRQFRLNVKYKSDKKYIISDALSRLINIIKLLLFEDYLKFDVLYDCVTQALNFIKDFYVYFVIII